MRIKGILEVDYFGGGGGAPGFLTPVVSYAPRPMLKADKSRRIMLSSAQAIMVRQVETAGKERCCDRRDARVANALRRVRNEMKNSPGKHHERFLYRYFPRPENRQTNELPIHPPKQIKKRFWTKTGGASDGCRCSRDRKGDPF